MPDREVDDAVGGREQVDVLGREREVEDADVLDPAAAQREQRGAVDARVWSTATVGMPAAPRLSEKKPTFAPMSTALRTSRRSITGSIAAQRDSHPSARVAKRTGSEGTGW